ncbi:MAG: hypothetical protein WCZ18_07370 [Ottowia sp.]|nr:hypothetical protein [Ottowia sp.]
MTDDLAGALMTAPLRGCNDCGCAAMMGRLSVERGGHTLDAERLTPNLHQPPQAAFIHGPQRPRSSVIRHPVS